MVLRLLGVVGVLLMGGCMAGRMTPPPLSPDHPASVDAPQAPYVPSGSVLVEDRTGPFPGPTSEPASPSGGHEHHEMSTQPAGAVGMGAMQMGNPSATQPQKAEATYTCSMHPEVVRNAPGDCPKCGMPLVRQKQQPVGEHHD